MCHLRLNTNFTYKIYFSHENLPIANHEDFRTRPKDSVCLLMNWNYNRNLISS